MTHPVNLRTLVELYEVFGAYEDLEAMARELEDDCESCMRSLLAKVLSGNPEDPDHSLLTLARSANQLGATDLELSISKLRGNVASSSLNQLQSMIAEVEDRVREYRHWVSHAARNELLSAQRLPLEPVSDRGDGEGSVATLLDEALDGDELVESVNLQLPQGPDDLQLLIAEDDPFTRSYLKRVLEGVGLESTDVEDGEQALEHLATGSFDVAILDWMMPGKKGIDVVRALRAKKISTYVIIHSSRCRTIDVVTALNAGADDFVSKPCDADELKVRVLAGFRRVRELADPYKAFPERPLKHHSCFISYSGEDERFVRMLHERLTSEGVDCWYAPERMRIGDSIRDSIDKSISIYEKLLLVLSRSSIESPWVETEVEIALEKERVLRRKAGLGSGDPDCFVLIPIRLDDSVFEASSAWAKHIRATRHIGDFSSWKDEQSFEQSSRRLLRDLGVTRV